MIFKLSFENLFISLLPYFLPISFSFLTIGKIRLTVLKILSEDKLISFKIGTSILMENREKLIRDFWSFFDQREFEKAKSLLHEEFIAMWETTNEVFPSRDAFIKVNVDYPGNWHTIPQKVELFGKEGVSIVSVYYDDQPDRYFATSFYEFKDNLIRKITEYWATVEKPPEWRKNYVKAEKS